MLDAVNTEKNANSFAILQGTQRPANIKGAASALLGSFLSHMMEAAFEPIFEDDSDGFLKEQSGDQIWPRFFAMAIGDEMAKSNFNKIKESLTKALTKRQVNIQV